jgi:cholesterol transport system auxiliary component
MKRRAFLAVPMLLSACGLAERPYAERRQWPLMARRPRTETPRRGAPILLVRGLRAGPGLEQRGLQSLQADGSIRSEFYEEWAAPPAQAVEEALRVWLADSGLYSAVVASGTRLEADHVLEGELTGLWSIPATGQAHIALGITVVAERPTTTRVLLQQRLTAEAPLAGTSVREAVEAQSAALANVLAQVEAALRR